MGQSFEATAPVQFGCLVYILGNGLHAAKVHQHDKRRTLPYIDDAKTVQGNVVIAQKGQMRAKGGVDGIG